MGFGGSLHGSNPDPLISALGQKRTSECARAMSALRARLYKIAKPPRRTAPRRSASWPFRLAALRKFSAELFHKSVGCDQIGKTPPKINFTFYDDSPSVPRLNFYRAVKVDNPAAQFDVQFIVRNGKLGDVGMLPLVCDGLPAGWLTRHNAPPVKDKYLWMNAGLLQLFAAIRRPDYAASSTSGQPVKASRNLLRRSQFFGRSLEDQPTQQRISRPKHD